MDTLNPEFSHLFSSSLMSENSLGNGCRMSHDFEDFQPFGSSSDVSSPQEVQSSSGGSSNNNSSDEKDNSLAMIKFIGDTLMEEDLERLPCMYYDCMALQATEESFHDALLQNDDNQVMEKFKGGNCIDQSSSGNSSPDVDSFVNEENWINYMESNSLDFPHFDADSSVIVPESGFSGMTMAAADDSYQIQELSMNKLGQFQPNDDSLEFSELGKGGSENGSSTLGKKQRECIDDEEDRSSKLLATSETSEADYPESLEMNVLLCSQFDSASDEGLAGSSQNGANSQAQKIEKSKRRRAKGSSKGRGVVLPVAADLRSLLLQCAQAVANFETRSAEELLKKIRQHSKPTGDATERVAHFLANALEARMLGTGTSLYASSGFKRVPASEILKAYKAYVTACPFRRMSNIYANKSIMKVADKVAGKASTVHIIDFGILYGFQWPCLIKTLSELPGGPPKLRITGIDCPQPGFRPAERVEATGRRLAKFCNQFNVPFEYIAIAQKWETIRIKDLKIEKDEVVAANCLYRLENVPDETVVSSSPRDAVLRLIKKMNPDIFVHGVTNGAYNSPFFATRFREALFHFSSLFDMFDATLPKDDQQRMLFEKMVIGREAMNVIACEDTARVERSETYKQWQSRNLRAGFTQLPLNGEFVSIVRDKVKKQYHKDFIVDEDGNWMLQGWKGKVIYALSSWKSTKRPRH